jgi:LPS sulfotransferase NodH
MIHKSIIISCARSGSNYLLDTPKALLPASLVLSEIFRPEGGSLDELYDLFNHDKSYRRDHFHHAASSSWNSLCELAEPNYQHIVAKLFYIHLSRNDPFWELISTDHTIIHLVRRNIFNCYVSEIIAIQTGQWIKNNNTPKIHLKPITIDTEDLTQYFKKRMKWSAEFKKKFDDKKYFEIYYEDIESSNEPCILKLSEIYKIKPSDIIESRVFKQKLLPNSELIANYDEVKEFDIPMTY